MRQIDFTIPELESMKRYPETLYCIGNLELLKRPKISVVGSRKPTAYTRHVTSELVAKLSGAGICIVSGAAMGVDAVAHQASLSGGTIAVMGNGLDIRYPAVNSKLIRTIETEGLVLGQFEPGFRATPWSFVVRNEIVTALGDVLIVAQADPDSGSLRSAEFARKMDKEVFVLLQRIGESDGTNALAAEGLAEVIYDIDAFVGRFAEVAKCADDPFLEFCRKRPSYEEAVAYDAQKVFSYEIEGKIAVTAGRIVLL